MADVLLNIISYDNKKSYIKYLYLKSLYINKMKTNGELILNEKLVILE